MITINDDLTHADCITWDTAAHSVCSYFMYLLHFGRNIILGKKKTVYIYYTSSSEQQFDYKLLS